MPKSKTYMITYYMDEEKYSRHKQRVREYQKKKFADNPGLYEAHKTKMRNYYHLRKKKMNDMKLALQSVGLERPSEVVVGSDVVDSDNQ